MNITINGKLCTCEKGEFLLTVARRNGITIPTLCHHPALAGQGSCRVCLVEVDEGRGPKIVVSCVYPVQRECTVETNSERVKRERGMVLALLRKRAPDSQRIAMMCKALGAPELPRLTPAEAGKCILCGLCTRACTELSVGAISTVNRGVLKEIATPYHEESAVCVGCGACASVCPTDAIPITETADSRTIWGKTFQLVRCAGCGRVMGTREELELAAKRSGQEPETLCEHCRKGAIAQVMAAVYGEDTGAETAR